MSSDQSNKGHKRKRGYYAQSAKGKRPRQASSLDVGMRGFLITCNKREKESVREAYNLFNEYADDMYGSEQVAEKSKDTNAVSSDEEEDVEAALAKEVQALKETSTSTKRRFQVVESGANNCVFIKTTVERPDELVHKILSDIYDSQKSRSRFMLRVTPVLGTCRAEESKIEALANEILPRYFDKDSDMSYSIMYKVRNNGTVGRKMIFSAIGNVLSDLCPKVTVNLDKPDLIIAVDVLRTVCCLGVLKDYIKYRKYNIQEVAKCQPQEKTEDTEKKVTESSTKEIDCPPECPQEDTPEMSSDPPPIQAINKDEQEKETAVVDNVEKTQDDAVE